MLIAARVAPAPTLGFSFSSESLILAQDER